MALAAIQSAYSYYLTTYGKKMTTPHDTHKKSELRNIYNNIVKLNKESPLYKIKTNTEVQTFAIDIKENARHIQNVVSSLSGSEDIMKAFQKKSAVSSQKDVVKAKYIGKGKDKDKDSEPMTDFKVEVKQLAKPQINIGKYLKNSSLDLPPDSYSFDLETNVNAYEFQFNVNPEDTNYTVLQKLSNLITNAGVGLNASIIEATNGHSALKIESISTGLLDDEECLYRVNAAGTNNSSLAIEKLGIGQVAQEAQNSIFYLDGQKRSSFSNTFTINNAFELTLQGISPEDQPAVIGFKADVDSIADNVHSLVDSYNGIIQTALKYSDTQQNSGRLFHDMGRSAFEYKNELDSIGLIVNDDGTIEIDPALLEETIRSDNAKEQFEVLNDFKKNLNTKASYAVLNPMEYVDKIMIAYKNPGRNFSTPYVTSIYSGMMMDRFC